MHDVVINLIAKVYHFEVNERLLQVSQVYKKNINI